MQAEHQKGAFTGFLFAVIIGIIANYDLRFLGSIDYSSISDVMIFCA